MWSAVIVAAVASASALDLSQVDPATLVRVDDPRHPDAIVSSATGSLLRAPPDPGTPWRWAAIPELDEAVASEAVEVTHADLWHVDGARGQGVKIAVFDLGWFGGEANPDEIGAYETHDCWTHPSCEPPMDPTRPRFASEDGAHGWACAEIIRDLAPDADIHLVRVNSFTDFENAAAWAIRAGIDLVSISMSFYNLSFYDGSGPFEPLIRELEAHDVLVVTSSGNDARAHWEGRYLDGDGDGRMDLDGTNGLTVYLASGARSIYVSWDQYRRCGDTDLDAFVFDVDGNLVGGSSDVQDATADRCESVERVKAFAAVDGWYRLEVVHRRGATSHLDVDIVGRGGTSFLDAMAQGSVVDPAADPLVFAVGAVRADGYLENDIESFSSQGPTAAGVAKPEIAGPNGVSTAAYGPVGFFGTSASTPAVTALIALILSDDPSLTPREAAAKLQAWAWGDGATFSEPDPRWGAGKARLPLPDPSPTPCGRRPLVMPLFVLPLHWVRRRLRDGSGRC